MSILPTVRARENGKQLLELSILEDKILQQTTTISLQILREPAGRTVVAFLFTTRVQVKDIDTAAGVHARKAAVIIL